MTQPTLPPVLTAGNNEELLRALKDLKNGVIGNTWKKVEVAENEHVLGLLLGLLSPPINEECPELVIEAAVIIGAIANVGALTIRPLLLSGTPTHLMRTIKSLTITDTTQNIPPTTRQRLLASLLRAIRNLSVTTADLVWGHMWGVGAEKKVVGTGLVGDDLALETGGKGKEVVGKGKNWRVEAIRALSSCFVQGNLSCLMTLIHQNDDPQILLPLYQLLSRLIALPSHREALARWIPPTSSSSSSSTRSSSISPKPFILTHLLDTISTAHGAPGGRKANGKILEAALDLLAAVVKGQPLFAHFARRYNPDGEECEDERDGSGIITCLMDILVSSPKSVRIASANCLTNILKADKGQYAPERVRSAMLNLRLLDAISNLLKTEGLEERVKICFILAALVSDHADLQKCAFDKGIPKLLLDIILELDKDEQKGGISSDLASRSREAILLALASLSFLSEPTRSLIADSVPNFPPILLKALSHPSYGVRAAACQVTRALSRGIAITRTSLVDSGIGEEVIQTLKREVVLRKRREADHESSGSSEEDDLGERAFTVEVAATAAICNLITDFSPLQASLLKGGGIELLCELSRSPFGPLAQNALWAIKNLVFHAPDPLKTTVMTIFGWTRMRELLLPATPIGLRVQALEIVQNLTADALPSEIGRCLESLGEDQFLSLWVGVAREGQEVELRIPALFVMSNLALGNEKVRATISAHVEILEVLSEALNAKMDQVKVPAIRSLRHLIESNAKTHRPRQGMLDLLQPYQLKTRLKELAETSPSLDVCHGAVGLLEVLDRGRENTASVGVVVGSAPK